MIRHPILPGAEPPKPHDSHSTVFQGVAALAQVIIAVVAYVQLKTSRAWWILALGAALLVFTFGGRLGRIVRDRWRQRHDDRLARRVEGEFRSVARTFGKLVSPNDSTTLQAGLGEAFRNYHGVLERLHVPSEHLFDEMLHNLVVRLDEEPSDAAHLLRALAEFYTVVSAHSTQVIQPVFRTMPKDLREMLSPDARGGLNSFRERYIEFLAAFTKFTEDLEASLQGSRLHSTYYVFRPNALI